MAMRVSGAGRSAVAGVALGVALLAGASACSKSESKKQSPAEPAQAAERREQAAKLTAPPLFANIPADTPYAMASFEPIPLSYWEKWGPMVRTLLDSVPQPPASEDPPARFAIALLRDLRANMSQDGLRKLLGIDAKMRFAIYGVGIVPVMRIELADEKALLATVERLQRESGLALPTASVSGRSYWRFGDAKGVVVVAVSEGQLIAAGGPTAMVDKVLPIILGIEKPNPSMADGGAIKAVAAQHGFAGYGIAYVDSANLLKVLTAASFFRPDNPVPPACVEQMGAMARRFPRFAFGYDDISDKRVGMRFVLETEAALTARLKQLVVEVPGLLAGAPAEPAIGSFGLGMDLDKARLLALDAVTAIEAIGTACGDASATEDMAQARASLSQPLPPGLDKIRGGMVSVLDGDLGPDGKPRAVEAFAVVAADDPSALVKLVREQAPPGAVPELAADGQYHQVVPEGAVPGLGAIRAAIKPHALVAAVGARGSDAAERSLGRTGASPLFYIAYDYAKIVEKITKATGSTGLSPGETMVLNSFGTIGMWGYPTDHGFAMAISVDFR